MLDLKQREVYGMKRETFGSRLGFILVSAGCAVGIGNVWKFPYMCGQFGGAAFILIYLVFLLIMGIPVMVCEFGVGRASRHSVAAAYETLEPKGTKWHITKWIGIIGCYFLMMFYTTVGGWMLYYCVRSFSGDFVGADMETVSAGFSDMLGNMPLMTFWTILIWCMCIWNPERYRKSIQVHDDSIALDHDRTCDSLCDDERCRSGNPLLSDS